jgi:hypothetical protein
VRRLISAGGESVGESGGQRAWLQREGMQRKRNGNKAKNSSGGGWRRISAVNGKRRGVARIWRLAARMRRAGENDAAADNRTGKQRRRKSKRRRRKSKSGVGGNIGETWREEIGGLAAGGAANAKAWREHQRGGETDGEKSWQASENGGEKRRNSGVSEKWRRTLLKAAWRGGIEMAKLKAKRKSRK